MDNLIVVHNLYEKISFIYDIRKHSPTQTIGSPQRINHEPLLAASESKNEQIEETGDSSNASSLKDLEEEQKELHAREPDRVSIEESHFNTEKVTVARSRENNKIRT